MAHFYLVDGDLPEVGDLAVIEGAEAKHAASVSRIRVGERLLVGDGVGTVVEGPVETAASARVEVRVESRRVVEMPAVRLTLVQALAKGDRDELAVQAATELGVDAVVPWQANRSVSRWEGAKAVKGVERWRSIVREASKQSLRPRQPVVADSVSSRGLAKLVEAAVTGGERVLVLDPRGETGLAAAVAVAGDSAPGIWIVIGPEGGVSPEELSLLADSGATAVRLGDEVLRTSTAGPAALSALSVLLGRWV